jgi:hypothetical protein
MRPLVFALVLALLLALAALATRAVSQPAAAQPRPARLVIVVHAENKVGRIDKSGLKSMYLGLTTYWPGELRVKAYHRVHDGAIGKPFFRDVLGMTPARYRHTWQKRQLSGQGVEPEVVASAAALVAKVAASAGAIGYMLESEAAAADARVRLIPLD